MALTDDEITHFLAGRRNAILGVNRKNGPPHLTTVWFLWNGETFQISTRRTLQKFISIQRDPLVSLCIDDPVAFRSVVVQGHAEIVEDNIWDTTQEIIERYVDKRFATKLMAAVRTEPRVLLRVYPQKWLSWQPSPGDDLSWMVVPP